MNCIYKNLVDSHCHLNKSIFSSDNYKSYIQEAVDNGMSAIISSALTKSDFQLHLDNRHSIIRLTAGIHPYYQAQDIFRVEDIHQLAKNKMIWGIGEIGFDKRNPDHTYQYKILYEQLEIARTYNLPVIFHIVGRYNELFTLLRDHFPDIRGYIHGFHGSLQLMKMLTKLNIGFSIGTQIINQKNAKQVLKAIFDYGYYYFETDTVFDEDMSGLVEITNKLIDTIKSASELSSFSVKKLIDKQWENFVSL